MDYSRFIEVIMDKLEETLNNIDSNELLEDIAEELIDEYLGDPEDKVREVATEYIKNNVCFETELDKKIDEYVRDLMTGL